MKNVFTEQIPRDGTVDLGKVSGTKLRAVASMVTLTAADFGQSGRTGSIA